MTSDILPEGVSPLDHTADVGITIVASDLASLFDRAARGAVALAQGAVAPQHGRPLEQARLVLDSDDIALLLASWLREITFEHSVHARAYRRARFDRLDERGLDAEVLYGEARNLVREIKGVTFHGLDVRHVRGQWQARVIFDV